MTGPHTQKIALEFRLYVREIISELATIFIFLRSCLNRRYKFVNSFRIAQGEMSFFMSSIITFNPPHPRKQHVENMSSKATQRDKRPCHKLLHTLIYSLKEIDLYEDGKRLHGRGTTLSTTPSHQQHRIGPRPGAGDQLRQERGKYV